MLFAQLGFPLITISQLPASSISSHCLSTSSGTRSSWRVLYSSISLGQPGQFLQKCQRLPPFFLRYSVVMPCPRLYILPSPWQRGHVWMSDDFLTAPSTILEVLVSSLPEPSHFGHVTFLLLSMVTHPYVYIRSSWGQVLIFESLYRNLELLSFSILLSFPCIACSCTMNT